MTLMNRTHSQAELISKGYHSLVPGLISVFFREDMGPFNNYEFNTWNGYFQCQCLVHPLASSCQNYQSQMAGSQMMLKCVLIGCLMFHSDLLPSHL